MSRHRKIFTVVYAILGIVVPGLVALFGHSVPLSIGLPVGVLSPIIGGVGRVLLR